MIFGILYAVLEKGLLGDLRFYPATGNAYDFNNSIIVIGTGSLIMGLVMGSVEVLYLGKLFQKRSFGEKLILKNLIYLIAICFFLICITFIGNSRALGLHPFHPEVFQSTSNFLFTSFVFWSIVFYMAPIIGVTLFISEIGDNVGQGVLANFITGKYHKAREEERIFMFLDMKSSTTIAEKLGHVRYYDLLNMYYADLTDAIIETSGRIYQYVGDEVIVRWSITEGIKDSNCIKCFFMMQRRFEEKSAVYMKEFGLVPGFKAGFHHGKVTMGEIGVVKKEIVFTGDVLNTTARIQSLCNSLKTNLLISQDLLEILHLENKYDVAEMGEFELRGKQAKMKLYQITVENQNMIVKLNWIPKK